MIPLSYRLECALQYTKGFHTLRDVGCDHAYFPIKAVLLGYVSKAIASDNKQKPYENARTNVAINHLEKQIDVILKDGLDGIKEDEDVVSILGMGGHVISEILENSDLSHVKRLILGPNSDQHIVRSFLQENHFAIVDEEFIKDQGKFYQIIIAEVGKMKLTPNELKFGPINIQKQSDALIEFVHKMLVKLELAKIKSQQKETTMKLASQILMLKDVLK